MYPINLRRLVEVRYCCFNPHDDRSVRAWLVAVPGDSRPADEGCECALFCIDPVVAWERDAALFPAGRNLNAGTAPADGVRDEDG